MPTPAHLISVLVPLLALVWALTASAERIVLLNTVAETADGQTRLTFRLSADAEYRVHTLANPDRLVIDLPPLDWLAAPAHLERISGQISSIASVRFGWFQPGTYRIVLDLAGPVEISSVSIASHADAYALTLIWKTAPHYRDQRFGAFVAPPVPKRPPVEEGLRKRPLIVLDAGHGGVDPGAIGKHGIKEKEITLRAVKILAAQLNQTGRYKVLLTRTEDRFLKLRERIDIARRAKADLFISLHADSAGSERARGLSVYSLSEKASDKVADALARRENKADVIAGVDLSDEESRTISILIDLAQRETMNKSVRFANRLIQAAAIRVPILSRAHRQAGFAVLKAPDTPSVLVELGFLSNADEEQLLSSGFHLTQIALGISAAVDGYFADWSAAQR